MFVLLQLTSKIRYLGVSFFSSGEGNGTPLQYSCLENPMGGGAWKAAVHEVAKIRTRLIDFTFHFSLFTFMHWRRQWQPTPVFLPGESQGRGNLGGCRLVFLYHGPEKYLPTVRTHNCL